MENTTRYWLVRQPLKKNKKQAPDFYGRPLPETSLKNLTWFASYFNRWVNTPEPNVKKYPFFYSVHKVPDWYEGNGGLVAGNPDLQRISDEFMEQDVKAPKL